MRKELIFNENYDGFNHFYDTNKNMIYKSLLELFEKLRDENQDLLTLSIHAIIENIEWKTDMKFYRSNQKILTNEMISYFEEIEDYESCQKIINLYKELTS
jgi:hypothetical protein